MRDLLVSVAALAAMTLPSVALADDACPPKITPEVESALGAAAATLGPGETVYTPAGAMVIGRPVSYVLVHRDADGKPITEIDYRFQGLNRPYGQRYTPDLRKSFDHAYPGTACTSNGSCATSYTGPAAGQLADAELGEADLTVPKGAQSDALSLVKADYDLSGADPVFLICHYKS